MGVSANSQNTAPLLGSRKNWRKVRFGDFADSIGQRVEPAQANTAIYVGLEHLDPECLHIKRWGTPSDVEGTKLRFCKGDIIFGRRRAYQRKLAVAECDGICSAHAMVVRAKPDQVLPEFLPFLMQSDRFMKRAVEISVGSLSPTINWKTLKTEEFLLPPLDEQRRIAEILWAADEVVEKHGALYQETTRSRQAVWDDYIRRLAPPSVPIGQVAQVRNGTTPSRNNPSYWAGGTVPWLSSGKIHDRIITTADELITEQALANSRGSFMRRGTVLVAMIGQGKTRGTTAYLDVDACINQNLAGITCGESLDPWFLYFYLGGQYEKLRRGAHGSNQEALNCRILSEFPVPLPSREEQDQIVAQVRGIQTAADSVAKHAATAEAMLVRLLDALLKEGPDELQ